MLKLLHHLEFLLTATNEHGVHSPFVFDYVTKCLYVKPDYSKDKSENILLKSIAYFGEERILFAEPAEAENILRNASEEHKIHNDSLLLVDDIHGNSNNLTLWKAIQDHPKVTVTVDLFYCGAVFFRKEQAKEHFRIRI